MTATTSTPITGTPRTREGHRVHSVLPRAQLLHPLSADEVATYRRTGFIVIRGLLSRDEAAFYRDEADRMLEAAIAMHTDLGLDPKYNMRLEWDKDLQKSWKLDPFISLSPAFAALVRDQRITDRLCSLYDGFPPRLFKDKLIYKPPGSHGNSRHQDYNWWQGFPLSLLSVTIALDATNRENGCTQMWTGHQRGFLHPTDGEFINNTPLSDDLVADETHSYVELEPGDAAIFSAFTPHSADPNRSAQCRRAMFLSYNDSRDGEHYAAHYDHFHWYRTAGNRLHGAEADKHYFL